MASRPSAADTQRWARGIGRAEVRAPGARWRSGRLAAAAAAAAGAEESSDTYTHTPPVIRNPYIEVRPWGFLIHVAMVVGAIGMVRG